MIQEMTITDRAKAFFMEAGRGDLAERTTEDCTHAGSCCRDSELLNKHPHVTGPWDDDWPLIQEALFQAHKLSGHKVVKRSGGIDCECFRTKGTW